MPLQSDLRLDVATGLSLGARDGQEDAVLCDAPYGGAAGIVVLADGLGGHASGAVASRIAVTTVLEELASQRDAQGALGADIPELLMNAAQAANHAILAHADSNPDTKGLGATLLTVVVQGRRLYWLSIGDSPLFLAREGSIEQLNENHSLAPQFDFLARMGEMDPGEAANHPDRSCLTSALGCDPLRQIDCPEQGYTVRAGDVFLAASDGILTLSQDQIQTGIEATPDARPPELVDTLMQSVAAAGDVAQDNLSVAVLRVQPAAASMAKTGASVQSGVLSWVSGVSVLFPQALRNLMQFCSRNTFVVRAGRSK